jgi:hypothetical protein
MNAVNAKARLNICLSSRHYPNVSMGKNLELIVEDRKEQANAQVWCQGFANR